MMQKMKEFTQNVWKMPTFENSNVEDKKNKVDETTSEEKNNTLIKAIEKGEELQNQHKFKRMRKT